MPNWKVKSALHRLIGCLPYPRSWNEVFQHYVTGSIKLTAQRCEAKVGDCRTHLEAYQRHSPNPREDFSVLDLGTGWSAVVPISLALCGAREVWTCDLASQLSRSRIREAFVRLFELVQSDVLQQPLTVQPERLNLLHQLIDDRRRATPADLLLPLDVRTLVGDIREIAPAEASCDLIVSVDCIDEIAEPILAGILARFRRVLAPGGVLSLGVELADLYSYFDRSISPLNYLRYTDAEWVRYDSPLTPQNRLRITDYRRLLKAAGFEVVQERNTLAKPEDLARVHLAPQFQTYAPEDLLVTHSWMTAV